MNGRKVLRRARGSAFILCRMLGQKRVHFTRREELEDSRDKRLRQIMKLASTTVPYYRDYFRSNGLSYRDFSGVEDLKRLPVIDRTVVVEDPLRFVSTCGRGRRAVRFETSGTTGNRLPVWLDRRYLLSQAAVGVRERSAVESILGTTYRFKTLYINYKGSTVDEIWSVYREEAFTPFGASRCVVPLSSDLERVLTVIDEYRPDILVSYGSYLDLLFRRLRESKRRVHLPGLVRYGGDRLSQAGRELIEGDFGIPVLSNYGSVECLKIGFECGEHSGFHLHEDLVHVEIVRSDGERMAAGEGGEIMISNLANHGTVLLNYRLGDVASLSAGTCPCGRTTVRLLGIDGRVEDTIALEEGGYVHPREVWSVFKKEMQVLQYQLIQLAPSKFEVCLVTRDSQFNDDLEYRILARLRTLLGPATELECRFVRTLEREPSGKVRMVRSLRKYEEGRVR